MIFYFDLHCTCTTWAFPFPRMIFLSDFLCFRCCHLLGVSVPASIPLFFLAMSLWSTSGAFFLKMSFHLLEILLIALCDCFGDYKIRRWNFFSFCFFAPLFFSSFPVPFDSQSTTLRFGNSRLFFFFFGFSFLCVTADFTAGRSSLIIQGCVPYFLHLLLALLRFVFVWCLSLVVRLNEMMFLKHDGWDLRFFSFFLVSS